MLFIFIASTIRFGSETITLILCEPEPVIPCTKELIFHLFSIHFTSKHIHTPHTVTRRQVFRTTHSSTYHFVILLLSRVIPLIELFLFSIIRWTITLNGLLFVYNNAVNKMKMKEEKKKKNKNDSYDVRKMKRKEKRHCVIGASIALFASDPIRKWKKQQWNILLCQITLHSSTFTENYDFYSLWKYYLAVVFIRIQCMHFQLLCSVVVSAFQFDFNFELNGTTR